MRNSYRFFEAEKNGQYALELGLRELESLRHWYCKQGESRTLTQSLGHPQALPITGAVECRQKGPPPEALAKHA